MIRIPFSTATGSRLRNIILIGISRGDVKMVLKANSHLGAPRRIGCASLAASDMEVSSHTMKEFFSMEFLPVQDG